MVLFQHLNIRRDEHVWRLLPVEIYAFSNITGKHDHFGHFLRIFFLRTLILFVLSKYYYIILSNIFKAPLTELGVTNEVPDGSQEHSAYSLSKKHRINKQWRIVNWNDAEEAQGVEGDPKKVRNGKIFAK